MRTPDYLHLARTWRGVADHLHTVGVPFAHPLRAVWRELAWCHLLASRGLDPLAHLRRVVARLTGQPPPAGADAGTLLAALRPPVIPHLSRLPDPLRRCPAVCTAVALPVSELPELVVQSLADRVHDRGGEREVRFDWRCRPALLPVWWEGRLQVLRWGNRDRNDRKLPPTGWTWQESVEAGKWAGVRPVSVEVPASYAVMNGVWFKVKRGLRGLVVVTPADEPVVYLVCEPSTRYYRVMTRAEWMPVLVGEVI
jgi:hypothetical protein